MVVGGRAPGRIDAAQGLADRFTQADAETRRPVIIGNGPDDLDPALDLFAEIQKHRAFLSEDRHDRFGGADLTAVRLQQVFRSIQSTRTAYDARRRQVFGHEL